MNRIQNESPMPGEFTSMPTTRSTELLMRILGIYPIQESILACSHRPGISNLAQTCSSIYSTLASAVHRLQKPYPICTKDLKACSLCRTLVCEDCRYETNEQEPPSDTMSLNGYEYALVCGRTPESRAVMSRFLHVLAPLRCSAATIAYSPLWQRIKHNLFCELCFSKPRPRTGKAIREPRNEWIPAHVVLDERRRNIMSHIPPGVRCIHVSNAWSRTVPYIHNACACGAFEFGCDAPLHLVRAESVPIESELATLVYRYPMDDIPVELRCVPLPAQVQVPFGVWGLTPPSLLLPLYILDGPSGPEPGALPAGAPVISRYSPWMLGAGATRL